MISIDKFKQFNKSQEEKQYRNPQLDIQSVSTEKLQQIKDDRECKQITTEESRED